MLSIYPACFFEEENHYSVIFPDFNYLSTCGDSLQDAMEMAVDCLAGALFSAKLDNEDIPIPSKLEEMDPTKFGIEKEKKILHKFGSSFDTNIKWQFMRNMYLSSRLYYFTSYKHVQIDFENTFNFVLNRYFSTRIEFKMRYDDSADPNEKGSFIQIKEMLSFGLFFRI